MSENYPGIAGDLRGQINMNADGSIKAPEEIVQTAESARAIYTNMRIEHLRRIALYAQIEGQLSGNPPYNPSDLEKHKLSHIANFNDLTPRSLYEGNALSYWNLLNEAKYIFEIQLSVNSSETVKWADKMAEHLDFVVRSWKSFYTQANTLTAQLVKFGISAAVFSDERDWRWRTVELSRFFVPDQALTDVEQLTMVCVETPFTVQYLYQTYQKYKGTKNSPWNLDELADFLVYRANSYAKPDGNFTDMMDLQVRFQNLDTTWSNFLTDNVRLVSLLYREYDGKISHYIFDRFLGGFLYKKTNQYEDMDEAVVVFTASPGEFTIHSNRGLGHKLFSSCQATMQLDCSLVDAARWASTIFYKSPTVGNRDADSIRWWPGLLTNIGNAEIQQNVIGTNIKQIAEASQYLLGKLQTNITNSGANPAVPDADQGSVSPTEAKFRSFKEFNVLKNYVAHFYSQFDIIGVNMVTKLLHSKEGYPGYEWAELWKDRCIADGVPKELFETKGVSRNKLPKHFLKVSASRVAGDGSVLARILGLEGLAPDVGAFSAEGQQEYVRQKVSAYLGPQYVKAFVPPTPPDEIAGGASLAQLENNAMSQGQAARFSPDNEQRTHIVSHLQFGKSIIDAIQQNQFDIIEADKVFSMLIPHLQEHLQFTSRNVYEARFLESIKKDWNDLSEYARLNRKNATAKLKAELRKQQQAQEKTQEAMSDAERKDFTAQRDAERADFKVEQQVERAKEANVTRAEIQREKVREDAATNRMKVRLENQGEPLENQSTEDIRSQISGINGESISPNDFEGGPNVKLS